MDTLSLTLGDERSAGADAAWGWITAHAWPTWAVGVVTVTIPKSRSVASPLGYTEPRPCDPPAPPKAPESCGFASVTQLVADNDPRLILGERPGSNLVVVGPRGQGLLKALHLVGAAVDLLATLPWLESVSITIPGVGEGQDDLAADVAGEAVVLTAVGADVTTVVVEPDPLALTVNPRVPIFEHMDVRAPDLVVRDPQGGDDVGR